MHEDFVFVDEVVPGIRWDAKYATWDTSPLNPWTATSQTELLARGRCARP
jgi:hypothetical protein